MRLQAYPQLPFPSSFPNSVLPTRRFAPTSPRGGPARVLHAPLPNPLPCGERGFLGQARLRAPAPVLFEIPRGLIGLMTQDE